MEEDPPLAILNVDDDAGSRGLRCVLTDCQTLWQQVLPDLHVALEEHGATVTFDSLPTISADEQQLRLVLLAIGVDDR